MSPQQTLRREKLQQGRWNGFEALHKGNDGRVQEGRSRRIRAFRIGELKVGCKSLELELHELPP